MTRRAVKRKKPGSRKARIPKGRDGFDLWVEVDPDDPEEPYNLLQHGWPEREYVGEVIESVDRVVTHIVINFPIEDDVLNAIAHLIGFQYGAFRLYDRRPFED
jgi:hypothetical protein